MTGVPETCYAPVGEHAVAYQVVGVGSDLLYVPTAQFPIDLLWDEPTVAGHLHRMASFSRLILTDLLGVGSSDSVPITDHAAMQSWTDGLVAVLDAVGSDNASIFVEAANSLPVLMLAASHPERCGHLCYGTRLRASAARPTTRSAFPNRRSQGGSKFLQGPWERVHWLTRWQRAGRATPPSAVGGRAVSGWRSARGIARRCLTSGCGRMSARCSTAFKPRHCYYGGEASVRCLAAMR
jgi:pimeloyl-ACP methyl ester carboxylesterase